MENKVKFEDLKAEYSNPNTTEIRKKELIAQMRKELISAE